ncbi:hypothetical protein [Lederbergia graminis]|uniref:Uncharacterized protein n=1 Tax=Lederbergia graminis TaxID=735518 RepID=A0ABW0LLH7_9BACI
MSKKLLLILILGVFLISGCSETTKNSQTNKQEENIQDSNEHEKNIQDPIDDEEFEKVDPIQIEKDIREVITTNLEYANQENIEGYLSTIHLIDKDVDNLKKEFESVFLSFDLKHTLNRDIEMIFISEDGTKAEVLVQQKSVSSNGDSDYQDNNSTLIQTLLLDNGKWKIYETEVQSVEYLGNLTTAS